MLLHEICAGLVIFLLYTDVLNGCQVRGNVELITYVLCLIPNYFRFIFLISYILNNDNDLYKYSSDTVFSIDCCVITNICQNLSC